MKFKIFTLHPDIFISFINNSLIARAISKQIIEIKTVDWRQGFGIGNYKQVDDKPFGGGSGMVLMADPIINAMIDEGCFEGKKPQTKSGNIDQEHKSFLPNNAQFYEQIKSGELQTKKVNILMTPRGFPVTQQTVQWLARDFEEINILCGRYEGFDARINDHIDLELSVGNFVLNGGEVASMCIVEAVSRLIPDFITKNTSVLHDSFSSGLNNYSEFEFENSKTQYQRELEKSKGNENLKVKSENSTIVNLFNDTLWLQNILPYIEHPQYTRPQFWVDKLQNQTKIQVPSFLLTGDHAKIQKWRVRWW
jgi:tRNA (guanine37-N1)-methyltransferase